jgi:hypothetical protein
MSVYVDWLVIQNLVGGSGSGDGNDDGDGDGGGQWAVCGRWWVVKETVTCGCGLGTISRTAASVLN